MTYSPEQLRYALVEAALEEWRRAVKDTQPGYPGDVERIGGYYRGVGGWWNSYLEKYGDGAYREVYVVDGERKYMSWCGIFVGWCGLRIGDYVADDQCVPIWLRPQVASTVLPSTYKMSRDKLWRAAADALPDRPNPQSIERGDIVVVGHDKPWGDHITLALGPPEAGKVETVSGNVSGAELGDGTTGEGVGLKTYDLSDVARVCRLLGPHFEDFKARRAA